MNVFVSLNTLYEALDNLDAITESAPLVNKVAVLVSARYIITDIRLRSLVKGNRLIKVNESEEFCCNT